MDAHPRFFTQTGGALLRLNSLCTEIWRASYLVDANGLPVELNHVHDLDRIVCVLLSQELDERISLVHPRHSVLGHADAHCTGKSEDGGQHCVCRWREHINGSVEKAYLQALAASAEDAVIDQASQESTGGQQRQLLLVFCMAAIGKMRVRAHAGEEARHTPTGPACRKSSQRIASVTRSSRLPQYTVASVRAMVFSMHNISVSVNGSDLPRRRFEGFLSSQVSSS